MLYRFEMQKEFNTDSFKENVINTLTVRLHSLSLHSLIVGINARIVNLSKLIDVDEYNYDAVEYEGIYINLDAITDRVHEVDVEYANIYHLETYELSQVGMDPRQYKQLANNIITYLNYSNKLRDVVKNSDTCGTLDDITELANTLFKSIKTSDDYTKLCNELDGLLVLEY